MNHPVQRSEFRIIGHNRQELKTMKALVLNRYGKALTYLEKGRAKGKVVVQMK